MCELSLKFCAGVRGGVDEAQGGVEKASVIVKSHGDPARARHLSAETKVYYDVSPI